MCNISLDGFNNELRFIKDYEKFVRKMFINKFLQLGIISLIILISFYFSINGEVTKDHAIIMKTVIDTVPTPRIIFTWDKDTSTVDTSLSYTIWRKYKTDNVWGNEYAELGGAAVGFIDSNISTSIGYEYKFKRKTIKFDAFTYIYAGIALQPGKLQNNALLLVDETYAPLLKNELDSYILDLIGTAGRSYPGM